MQHSFELTKTFLKIHKLYNETYIAANPSQDMFLLHLKKDRKSHRKRTEQKYHVFGSNRDITAVRDCFSSVRFGKIHPISKLLFSKMFFFVSSSFYITIGDKKVLLPIFFLPHSNHSHSHFSPFLHRG